MKQVDDLKNSWKGSSTLSDYRHFLARRIRESQVKQASGNAALLADIESCSDDYLVSKWLWTFSIVGGPITFIAIPLLLSGITHLLPAAVMMPLWTLSKGAMAIIFVMFLVAVFVSKKS